MLYEELLEKERIQQSKYSPCLIKDEEKLSRVLFSPKHFMDDKVLPTAFADIFKGLSVLRENFNFQECLSKTISLLSKDDVNNYYGYVSAKVLDIKNIKHNNKYRIFYIIDTATRDRIGHADIHAIRDVIEFNLPKKALNYLIRYEISLVFKALNIGSV